MVSLGSYVPVGRRTGTPLEAVVATDCAVLSVPAYLEVLPQLFIYLLGVRISLVEAYIHIYSK
jgi:hypothetical protein